MTSPSWSPRFLNPTPRSVACTGRRRQQDQPPQRWTKLWLEALEDRLAPANMMVTNNHDCGPGSLRQAILDSGWGGTISFAGILAGQTIMLTANSGPLTIGRNLTISGLGADQLTVSGGGVTGVFSSSADAAEIDGLTITGGSTSAGAGLNVLGGRVTLLCDDIESNSASSSGGGVRVDAGSLIATNSTIANNSARFGAGLELVDSSAIITNCTIANNHSSGNSAASGMAVSSSLLTHYVHVESSTLTGNTVGAASQAADMSMKSSDNQFLSPIELHNPIVNGSASNPVGTPNAQTDGATAVITSLGHNISSDATGNLTNVGDLPGRDPFLGT